MRAVIQRVTQASCTVDGEITGNIGTGFLVLLGIEDADTDRRPAMAGAKNLRPACFWR